MRKNPELSNYYRTYTRDSVKLSIDILLWRGKLYQSAEQVSKDYTTNISTNIHNHFVFLGGKKKINTMFISTIYQYMNKKETPANSRRIDPLTIDITILIYQGECTN